MIPYAIDLPDLLSLSPQAKERWFDWWQPDLGHVCVDMTFTEGDDQTDIIIAGDTDLMPTLDKEHYSDLLPWPTITLLIAYLDEHGLYQDAKTGKTVLDSLPANDVLDAL